MWIRSHNDMLENIGALIAAALVASTHTVWLDIIMGLIIAIIVIHSSIKIILFKSTQQVWTLETHKLVFYFQ